MVAMTLFWLSLGLIVYTYVGFPGILILRGILFRRMPERAAVTPTISLVIVAHNEVHTIGSKIRNVLLLDYPRAKLEVIIASDGSDDGMDELIETEAHPGIRLLRFGRAGKIPALNAAVKYAKGEILVFSDANSMYKQDALRMLVAPFADPVVGAVGGNQLYVSESRGPATSSGERLYWRYDRMLKQMQSRAGSMTSATGAIHAIRRTLFRPVPPGVSDDFLISTGAVVQGYRLIFEPDAIAYEAIAPSDHAEFQRKQRVIARALRGFWQVRALLNPLRYGFYPVQLLSHKLLRWSVCWMLIVLLLSSLLLYNAGATFRWVLSGQVAFYVCAFSTFLLRDTIVSQYRAFKVFSIPYYFCMANYASLRAWLRVWAGDSVDMWSTHRTPAGLAHRYDRIHPPGGADVNEVALPTDTG